MESKKLDVETIENVNALRSLHEIKSMAKKVLTQYYSIKNDNVLKNKLQDRLIGLLYALNIDLKGLNDLVFDSKLIELYNDLG